ncbi:MAG: hypothetical protein FRX49_12237 [Trebouxia sp. A1-2]|nr:MAG: hypothetical protein FRX49_12237 [Trebouxia sp. A1-2]
MRDIRGSLVLRVDFFLVGVWIFGGEDCASSSGRAISLSARFFSFLSLTPRVRSASSTLISMRRCTTVTSEQSTTTLVELCSGSLCDDLYKVVAYHSRQLPDTAVSKAISSSNSTGSRSTYTQHRKQDGVHLSPIPSALIFISLQFHFQFLPDHNRDMNCLVANENAETFAWVQACKGVSARSASVPQDRYGKQDPTH